MAITTNGGAGITADAVATLSNKTLEAPTINNATFTGQQAGLQIAFNDSIVFEGTTADAYETTLSAGEPTADRTVTLPNATTTLVGTDTTDTLTNKSISLTTNTVSGTISEFNTALSDANFATIDGSETLTNKTISASNNTLSGVILNTLTSATGDVIYASGADTPARLAIGTENQVLSVSAGGIPEWKTLAAGTTANDQAFAFAVQVFA